MDLQAWNMENAYTGKWVGSFNHIMMSSPGRWFFTLFAGELFEYSG